MMASRDTKDYVIPADIVPRSAWERPGGTVAGGDGASGALGSRELEPERMSTMSAHRRDRATSRPAGGKRHVLPAELDYLREGFAGHSEAKIPFAACISTTTSNWA